MVHRLLPHWPIFPQRPQLSCRSGLRALWRASGLPPPGECCPPQPESGSASACTSPAPRLSPSTCRLTVPASQPAKKQKSSCNSQLQKTDLQVCICTFSMTTRWANFVNFTSLSICFYKLWRQEIQSFGASCNTNITGFLNLRSFYWGQIERSRQHRDLRNTRQTIYRRNGWWVATLV